MNRIRSPPPWGKVPKRLKVKDLSASQKQWLGREQAFFGKSTLELSSETSIKYSTLQKYKRLASNDISPREKAGQPVIIDDELGAEYVQTQLTNQAYETRVRKYNEDIARLVSDTASKHNKLPKMPCARTIKNFEKKHNVDTVNSESTTNARKDAKACVWNFVVFAAMIYYFVKFLLTPPELIINMDATTFFCGHDSKGKVLVKVVRDEEKKQGKAPIKSEPQDGDNNMAFFIKFFLIINAAGDQFDSVYVVADDSMAEDDFYVVSVPGLGVGAQIAPVGHVCFCKTRAGNKKMFEWINEHVVCPGIAAIRAAHGFPPEQKAFFHLDGEAIQIACYKQGEKTLDHFARVHAWICKLGASSSSFQQACDAGDEFRGAKGKNRVYTDDDFVSNAAMYERIRKLVVETHVARLKQTHEAATAAYAAVPVEQRILIPKPPAKYVPMTSKQRKALVCGLMRIQAAFDSTTSRQKIQKSFEKVGIYPFSPEVIFKHCSTSISARIAYNIVKELPRLAQLFHVHGQIVDAELYKLSEIKMFKANPKDDRVMHSRRCTILNHPAVHELEAKKEEGARLEKLEKERLAAQQKEARVAKAAQNAADLASRKLVRDALAKERAAEKLHDKIVGHWTRLARKALRYEKKAEDIEKKRMRAEDINALSTSDDDAQPPKKKARKSQK